MVTKGSRSGLKFLKIILF